MCIYICISDAVKAHCYVQVTGNERLLSIITVAGIHNDRINVQDVSIFLNWYKTALNQLRKIFGSWMLIHCESQQLCLCSITPHYQYVYLHVVRSVSLYHYTYYNILQLTCYWP